MQNCRCCCSARQIVARLSAAATKPNFRRWLAGDRRCRALILGCSRRAKKTLAAVGRRVYVDNLRRARHNAAAVEHRGGGRRATFLRRDSDRLDFRQRRF